MFVLPQLANIYHIGYGLAAIIPGLAIAKALQPHPVKRALDLAALIRPEPPAIGPMMSFGTLKPSCSAIS